MSLFLLCGPAVILPAGANADVNPNVHLIPLQDLVPGRTYLISVEQTSLQLSLELLHSSGASVVADSPLEAFGKEYLHSGPIIDGAYTLAVEFERPPVEEDINALALNVAPVVDPGPWNAYQQGLDLLAAQGYEAAGEVTRFFDAAASDWQHTNPALAAHARLCAAQVVYMWGRDWQRAYDRASAVEATYANTDLDPVLHGFAIHLAGEALLELAKSGSESADTDFDRVLGKFQRAWETGKRIERANLMARALNSMGLLYKYEGRYGTARDRFAEAAKLFAALGSPGEVFKAQYNNAMVDSFRGDHFRALEGFQQAVAALPAEGFQWRRALALDGVANALAHVGRSEEALEAANNAAALHRELRDGEEIYSKWGLARAYLSVGEDPLARRLLDEVLILADEIDAPRMRLSAWRELGDLLLRERDYVAALDAFQQGLAGSSGQSDEAMFQVRIAQAYLGMDDVPRATVAQGSARAIAEAGESIELLADVYATSGEFHLQSSRFPEAVQSFEAARKVYVSLNNTEERVAVLGRLALATAGTGDQNQALDYGAGAIELAHEVAAQVSSPTLRAQKNALLAEVYAEQIARLMAANKVAQAYALAERSRALRALSLLAASGIGEGDAARRETLASLQEQLYAARSVTAPDQAAINRLQIEASLLRHELERERASSAPPKYLGLHEAQSALDADTALLQYQLGETESYAWLVTQQRWEVFRLAGRDEIRDAAKAALQYLRSGQGSAIVLRDLAGLVLEPVAHRLVSSRLVLAADDSLHSIPFAALPMRGYSGALVQRMEIISVPSISFAVAQRALGGATASGVAIIADPVYAPDDPRVTQAGAPRSSGASTGYARLQSAQLEYEGISALFADQSVTLFAGPDATRQSLRTPSVAQARYLHIASHGRLDATYPELSSLVLSAYDRQGRASDGHVRLSDIYGLDLAADLVVLSACDTGVGREVRGEGFVGFTQGFLHAGAKAVLVSLWPVPDRSTADLMVALYGHMVDGGLAPGAALRQAQMEIAKRWRHPRNWSGFVLVGDWVV